MRRHRPGQDPYWLTARFTGQCSRCNEKIQKDEQIFYYPNTRSVLCSKDDCGKQAARDLNAAKFDEEVSSYGLL